MADDLLTICQNVSDKIQIGQPSSIMGSSEETARVMRAAARDEIYQLVRRPEKGWTALNREHTFSTVAGIDSYNLPSGFSHFLDDTLWDRSRFWKMRGPLTRSEWQKYKSSVLGDTVTNRMRFQLRSDGATNNPTVKFFVDPVPAEVHEMVFEYVINGAVKKASDGTVQENWKADTDEPILDQWIVELGIAWRTLKSLGLPYDEELNEYENQADAAIGRDGGSRILSLARTPAQALITSCNVPDTGFG